MKFKALLTDNGIIQLEKRFIPALDKMGKFCHIYLTPDHFFILHNLLSPSSPQSIAQFSALSLFDDYRISSQFDNVIAFSIDLFLLLRALRSSSSICITNPNPNPNRLQIKLVKKLPPNSTNPLPFLTFESKGYKSAVIQDIPISKPLSRSSLVELQDALNAANEIPKTLVQVPDLGQLQNYVDRLKNVGELLDVTIGKFGDLYLQVSTSLITVGAEFRRLTVLGERASRGVGEDRDLSAQTRARRAIERGEAESVEVSLKHFGKSLQYHLAKPDCTFYGVGMNGGCLTVIFQFFVPGSRQTDKSISLHCRLPVLDPGAS
ncbi:Checkpoint protein Hus1/Mec3 [Dillenia turbinata]|uniref:Checkpoint protein Hus1/Mec3 n=1 Tax=Dillenia turbinata TaxID=194707 RepID=A0AAN8YWH7_9MAGN